MIIFEYLLKIKLDLQSLKSSLDVKIFSRNLSKSGQGLVTSTLKTSWNKSENSMVFDASRDYFE